MEMWGHKLLFIKITVWFAAENLNLDAEQGRLDRRLICMLLTHGIFHRSRNQVTQPAVAAQDIYCSISAWSLSLATSRAAFFFPSSLSLSLPPLHPLQRF